LVTPPGTPSSKTVIAEFGPFSIITLPDHISYVDENKNHRGTTMRLLSVTGVAGKVLVDDGQTIAEIDNAEHMRSSSSSMHELGDRIALKTDPLGNGEHIFLQVILKLMAKGVERWEGVRLKIFSRHDNGPPTGPGLGRHRAGFR
jgi:hypothetical protein